MYISVTFLEIINLKKFTKIKCFMETSLLGLLHSARLVFQGSAGSSPAGLQAQWIRPWPHSRPRNILHPCFRIPLILDRRGPLQICSFCFRWSFFFMSSCVCVVLLFFLVDVHQNSSLFLLFTKKERTSKSV